MQLQAMPAKTDMGRIEIERRGLKLEGGLRSLLLLVDGHRTVSRLEELARRLDAPTDALEQLLSLHLITDGRAGMRLPGPHREPANEPGTRGIDRYGILYALMTDIVREQLGVRGYLFQLRLERAQDDATLEALLPDLQFALSKKTSPKGASATVAQIRAAAAVAVAA